MRAATNRRLIHLKKLRELNKKIYKKANIEAMKCHCLGKRSSFQNASNRKNLQDYLKSLRNLEKKHKKLLIQSEKMNDPRHKEFKDLFSKLSKLILNKPIENDLKTIWTAPKSTMLSIINRLEEATDLHKLAGKKTNTYSIHAEKFFFKICHKLIGRELTEKEKNSLRIRVQTACRHHNSRKKKLKNLN